MTRSASLLLATFATLLLAGCDRHGESADDMMQHRFGADFFGAGGSVNLTDVVEGDAFLTGGSVATAGEVRGDLVAAGGEVSVGGSIGDDVYAAGGQVNLDAMVAGNARVAGGDVTVGPATVVGGTLSLSGGQLAFLGEAQDTLQASGGEVRIDGTVRGDAEVKAGEVVIGPATRIGGKLIVHSRSEPVVPAEAQIAGGVEFHASDVGGLMDDDTVPGDAHAVAHGVGSFLWMLGVFVTGTLFMLAFPAYSARAADQVGREPLKSLALGFVILLCLPVLAVLLLITIVGIPLALVLMMLYVLLMFLGWVTAALFVARKGLQVLRGAQARQAASFGLRMLALLGGLLALWLAGRVPVLGAWITFAALLLGIGALVWQGWPRRTPAATAAPA
jgi:hypothetical protein